MFKLSPRRNQRNNGFKVKHALQICVLLGISLWLIYQFQNKKSSYQDSSLLKKTTPEKQDGLSMIKLGRKDLDPRIEQMTAEDLKNGGQDAEEDKSFDDDNKTPEIINDQEQEKVDEREETEVVKEENNVKQEGEVHERQQNGLGSGSAKVKNGQEMYNMTNAAEALGGGKGENILEDSFNVTAGIVESKEGDNSTQTESELITSSTQSGNKSEDSVIFSGDESKETALKEQTEGDNNEVPNQDKSDSNSTSDGQNSILNGQTDMGEELKEISSGGPGEKINPSNDNDETTYPGENNSTVSSTSQNEGSASTSVLQEETDARTDLETMRQTETEGKSQEATE